MHTIDIELSVKSPTRVDRLTRQVLGKLGLADYRARRLAFHAPAGFEPEAGHCHFNVWAQCLQAGGEPVHGWILAEDFEHRFAEAVFHTVWRSPDGQLHDLTPALSGESELLFAPDTERRPLLASHDGGPAIVTYKNFRMLNGQALEPLQQVLLPVKSSLIERFGMWPWRDGFYAIHSTGRH